MKRFQLLQANIIILSYFQYIQTLKFIYYLNVSIVITGKPDLAYGKVATASSVLLSPSFATNGVLEDYNQCFHSKSDQGGLQWLEVDLGGMYNIEKEIVYQYSYDEWGVILAQYDKLIDTYVVARYVKVLKEVVAGQTPLQIQEIVVHEGNLYMHLFGAH
eukprot:Awhi_evm1s6718